MAKRKRGLGGSPAEHEKASEKYFRQALERYNFSIYSSERGECSKAFQLLMRAERFEGAGQAHRKESGKGMTGESVDKSAKAAMLSEEAFRGACLVGAGLAGLRRRRAKR